ncbi:hypothetical protein CPB83DRAFT_647023 [Crepidotus variabilis]|uniref:Uncharacterized protein n=1 Tax=Crepidotus variabilis TaxID=179855 RepID=A0A9P6E7K7_9AGAR|nr:hypothetical protein CPB83DRAFT_647023 [Crepidotus variabilis]
MVEVCHILLTTTIGRRLQILLVRPFPQTHTPVLDISSLRPRAKEVQTSFRSCSCPVITVFGACPLKGRWGRQWFRRRPRGQNPQTYNKCSLLLYPDLVARCMLSASMVVLSMVQASLSRLKLSNLYQPSTAPLPRARRMTYGHRLNGGVINFPSVGFWAGRGSLIMEVGN